VLLLRVHAIMSTTEGGREGGGGGGASERDKEGEEKGREGEQRRGGGGRERESARARKREREVPSGRFWQPTSGGEPLRSEPPAHHQTSEWVPTFSFDSLNLHWSSPESGDLW
jgi:hypothetical protein